MKLIIATGISGCGRKEHAKEWAGYCEKKGKKVKVYNTGEMMFKFAKDMGLKLNKNNILNADPTLLDVLRSAVLNGILEELQNYSNYDAVVLHIHSYFYWNSIFIPSFDRFISRFKTDMFVTFIEDFRRVKENLNQRQQWVDQGASGKGLTDHEILWWQNIKVETTRLLANFANKPFFAVPALSSVATFYKLVFHPEIETAYLAMPISHFREAKQRKVIDELAVELDKYFALFNPLSVEVVGAIPLGSREDQNKDTVLYRHIVYRDERWFVGQADVVIVFWPKVEIPSSIEMNAELMKMFPKTVPSPGADHETHEAFNKTKDVWVLFLGEEASPFVVHYATKMFYDKNGLLNFIKERYPERMKMDW